MENWKKSVNSAIHSASINVVENFDLAKKSISYSKEIKQHREIKVITGDEEIVRAFLINRLVNSLGYEANLIEIEKEYPMKAGHTKLSPRIDIILKDSSGNPFLFIEAKSPDKYESEKKDIDGQLFTLAHEEEKNYKTKISYLAYYTCDYQNEEVIDKVVIIDFTKYKTYKDWEDSGFISVGTEILPGYNNPRKPPYIKGNSKYDLKTKIDKTEIKSIAKNLHNVLWGGGSINDSEIFYSLVNIILAKIQDEYEREEGEEYAFQITKFGETTELASKIYDRINELYKKALNQQLNIDDYERINNDNVINRNKFPLNKLIYVIQELESFSFLEGRNSLDGTDILGDFFESITRDGFKQTKGQFFTPTPIVSFLLYALNIDRFCIDKLNNENRLPYMIDPSAGSGTYLIEALKIVTKEIKYKQKNKLKTNRTVTQCFEDCFLPDTNENKWSKKYIYGSEINFDLGMASKVNIIMHGGVANNIFVEDGLIPFENYIKSTIEENYLTNSSDDTVYPKKINGKFDIVFSNPPFSVELDNRTKKEIKNNFLFGDKKNSENLFIERYYQLLNNNGRLGVVLPENVFDTSDNKYIRLFLFKYFNIKAIISLPQVTFMPYTPTKTSILLAQKKSKAELESWNITWETFGKEWSSLKSKIQHYFEHYVENKKVNKNWSEDILNNIENNNTDNILMEIKRFLKDFIQPEDNSLDIKKLLKKYKQEITLISAYDKDTTEAFNFYNTWWVFGEVAKNLNNKILMFDAENVGYKRTTRGERAMPNDLYDIEYAPLKLNKNDVLSEYIEKISDLNIILENFIEEQVELEYEAKENEIKINELEQKINNLKDEIKKLEDEKSLIEKQFEIFYENNTLKPEYLDRVDSDLITLFKDGVLKKYKSEDIVLREKNKIKILDFIRQEVVWE